MKYQVKYTYVATAEVELEANNTDELNDKFYNEDWDGETIETSQYEITDILPIIEVKD